MKPNPTLVKLNAIGAAYTLALMGRFPPRSEIATRTQSVPCLVGGCDQVIPCPQRAEEAAPVRCARHRAPYVFTAETADPTLPLAHDSYAQPHYVVPEGEGYSVLIWLPAL